MMITHIQTETNKIKGPFQQVKNCPNLGFYNALSVSYYDVKFSVLSVLITNFLMESNNKMIRI